MSADGALRYAAEAGEPRRAHVTQGEFIVSDDPGVVLTTILGSCVAGCVRDPVAGVGGMNHFLLPEGHDGEGAGLRYGVQAMELLINGLFQLGARRERMEAKLFGGGRLMSGLGDIGAGNAAFAERFMQTEGIRIVSASLRGDNARRVQYWPVSGRARQVLIARSEDSVFAGERLSRVRTARNDGVVELF